MALTVPDLAATETFYTQVWRLTVLGRSPGVIWLRGSGCGPHVLALHERAGTPYFLKVSLRAPRRALAAGKLGA